MQLIKKYRVLRIPAFIMIAGIVFLQSCVNDLDTIEQITYSPDTPSEYTEELNLISTDSGFVQVEIFAKIGETFKSPEHITKLSEFLKVHFYNKNGIIQSTLTAQYGEINHETGQVFIRDSVVLKNLAKKQSLHTEELFWNQKDSTIYTNKNVLILTEGKGTTGRGKGLKTNQEFSYYKILNPVGSFDISK